MKVIEQHKQDERINLPKPIRLENWTRNAGRLTGNVYGHPHFQDGELVTTSAVLWFAPPLAQTRNTLYRLGRPGSKS